MALDEIGFGLRSGGRFLRGRHGPGFSRNTSRRTPLPPFLSANGFREPIRFLVIFIRLYLILLGQRVIYARDWACLPAAEVEPV